MFKKILVLCVLTISVNGFAQQIISASGQPSLANNEDMIKIADVGDEKMTFTSFLDKNSVQQDKNPKSKVIAYISLWQYKQPMSTEVNSKEMFSYIDAFYTKADCKNHKVMLLGSVSHDKEGNGFNSEKVASPIWMTVPNKSYAEYEMNFACKVAGY